MIFERIYLPFNLIKRFKTTILGIGKQQVGGTANEALDLVEWINAGIDAGEIITPSSGSGGPSNLSLGLATDTERTIDNDNGSGVTIPAVNPVYAGLMIAADKTKLDGLTNYVHPNHTGDVVSDGDGITEINPNKVTNTKLAKMPANTLKGNNTGSLADPVDLTTTQVKAVLNYTASEIINVPTGTISATTVQAALNELDAEKQPILLALEDGTPLNPSSIIQSINFTGSPITASFAAGVLTVNVDPGSMGGQAPIQFQNEGTALGGSGSVTTLNVVGRNIEATRVSNVVTITDLGVGVQLVGVDVATQPIINFIPGDNAFIQATNDNVNSRINVTIHSETYTQVYRNNGVTIKATKPGVTFTRTTASVWTVNVPLNCELISLDIFSTAAQNPGANVTLNINTLSTVYNQTGDFSTIHIPVITGLNLNGTTGSLPGNYAPTTGSTNLQPFVDSFGNGDIQIRIQNFNNASGLGTGATLLKLVF